MDIQHMVAQSELNSKIERVHQLLEEKGLDALLLRRVSSFAWATCGSDSHVITAASEGVASLLITNSHRYLITNNIEAHRLETEEKLAEQGWESRVSPWYSKNDLLIELTSGKKLGADGAFPGAADLSVELSRMRSQLTPEEILRFRALSNLCTEGLCSAVEEARPGMTEYQLAGMLSQAVESRGVQPIVNLIATDERIFAYRHPLPTDKPLQRYAMFVLCGRKWGLVCSMTRLLHFGPLPAEIRQKAEAVARVDAAMIAATRPGKTLGEVFRRAQTEYASGGYPDEWQNHHQGGSAGYEPRETTATPTSSLPILTGQVYAWNPSIAGVKSEDTILVGDQANEVLTVMPDWPVIDVQIGSQYIKRPSILVKE
jgi:Xaa-Pro aminopeptidase